MAVSYVTDDAGGEVRVETGRGLIQVLDESKGGRNVRIELKATHTTLQDPVSGWVDTQDVPTIEAAREAKRLGAELEYEIRVHRKTGIPPDKPIAELSNREKVRDVVKLVLASQAAPAARVDEPPPAEAPGVAVAPQGRRGLRTEEARPWQRLNTDGSLNLGSFEVQATFGMATLAYELLLEHNRAVAAKTGRPVQSPTQAQVRNLATYLLRAADSVQAAIRADGMADRMDNSHSRARGAIRQALDAYPVPWGATEERRQEWQQALAATGTMLLGAAVELVDVPLGTAVDPTPPAPTTPPSKPPEAPDRQGPSSDADLPDERLPDVPLSSQEADVFDDAQEAGLDPIEALRRFREANLRGRAATVENPDTPPPSDRPDYLEEVDQAIAAARSGSELPAALASAAAETREALEAEVGADVR